MPKKARGSVLEKWFLREWMARYPSNKPIREYSFSSRGFRFDFCWVSSKIAVEVQGIGPGHCSLIGMTQDYDKNLHALLLGWRIVYLTKTHLTKPRIDSTCNGIASLLGIPPKSLNKPKGYIPRRKRKGWK